MNDKYIIIYPDLKNDAVAHTNTLMSVVKCDAAKLPVRGRSCTGRAMTAGDSTSV